MPKPTWYRHYIGRNEGERRPEEYVFVDVETKEEIVQGIKGYTRHSLQLGVACHVRWKRGREPKEQYYDFKHATHFWEWLKKFQKKKRVLWVIAHNSNFDFTILGLWQLIETNTYAISREGREYYSAKKKKRVMSDTWHGLTAFGDGPFHIETECNGCRVNFSDLSNYYQCSLEEVGNTVGIPKGNWHDVKDNEQALRAYCHQDVEITKRAYLGLVERWEKEHNGNWQMSAAGLAYSNFRHKYMDQAIAVHNHPEAMRLEWASLYGGECRCWFRGKTTGKVFHYDVNSLYPSVMRDQIFPTSLVDVVIRPSRGMFRSLIERYACVAEVDIQCTTETYPKRQDKRIIYPVGRYTTTLAGPELMRALDSGHITHCYAMAIYTYAPIFKRYVLEWWEEKRRARATGDKASETLAKLMLNSLPAKFAQKTPVWIHDPRIDVVEPWKIFPWKNPDTGTIHSARSVGWIGQYMSERVATDHSMPAIYAYVTSYAREKMRATRATLTSGRVYYQDTDSILCDSTANESLVGTDGVIGDGIGQLRLVGVYDSCEFRGPKNYTLDGEHIISGVRRKDVNLGGMSWSGQRFEKVSAIFCRQPDSTVRVHTVDYETPGTETEGAIDAEGWTKPLVLDEQSNKYVMQGRRISKEHA